MSSRNKKDAVAKARAAAVKKPFPWGAVLTSSVVTVLLVGLLVYAVLNTGSAAPSPLKDADASVKGVQVAATKPEQAHKQGPLEYSTTPSSGGAHNGRWMNCTGTVYTQEVPEENVAHSMEHGAAWVSYKPDLPADQVKKLVELVEGTDYRLLSVMPNQQTPISVQAWGRQLTATSASDGRIEDFLKAYTNGPQTPEKGATCSSDLMTPGSDPSA